MPLDIPRFFQACNPSLTLSFSNLEQRKYYIDFASVRGGNIIRELERTIALEDKPTCQLFTGHIGCGKSTELLKLKYDLEQDGFHVVYFESDKDLDIGDVDVGDVLLAIARQVSASLEQIQIRLKPNFFRNLFAEMGKTLNMPMEIDSVELSVGIAKVTAKAKDSPTMRGQMRQYLEPRINGILEAINEQLLTEAHRRLLQKGKKGLVVLVDNLDRVDPSRKPNGRTQPEYLFVDRGEQLKKLACHVVYTIPLVLLFSSDLGPLINRFGGRPKVLPMVPVQRSDRSAHLEGLALLRQMVMTRAFPEQNAMQRLERVTEIFDQSDTLERLCKVSGGHVRVLMMLLYSCLQQNDPPISRETLENVIMGYRDDLVLGITDAQWDLLRRVSQDRMITEEPDYQALLRSLYVYEYRDKSGRWFDVNPALVEAGEF